MVMSRGNLILDMFPIADVFPAISGRDIFQRNQAARLGLKGSSVVDLLHQLQPDRLRTAVADRYQLEGKVGEGGMATVYLARDLRHERQVALKVLHPELAASLGPQRFLAEIRVVANLQHPHILPLFDSGST